MKTLSNLLAALSLLLSSLSVLTRPATDVEPTPALEGPTATPAAPTPTLLIKEYSGWLRQYLRNILPAKKNLNPKLIEEILNLAGESGV